MLVIMTRGLLSRQSNDTGELVQGMRGPHLPIVILQHTHPPPQCTSHGRPPRGDGQGEEGKRGEVLIQDEGGTSEVGLAEAPAHCVFLCCVPRVGMSSSAATVAGGIVTGGGCGKIER